MTKEVNMYTGHPINWPPTIIEQFNRGDHMRQVDFLTDLERPAIITLCGSTRFYEEFTRANYELTKAGAMVLTVGFFMHVADTVHGEGYGVTPAEKVALDVLHKRKISLSDSIYVINVGGYIGDSTRSEIDYAMVCGVPVYWLEQP